MAKPKIKRKIKKLRRKRSKKRANRKKKSLKRLKRVRIVRIRRKPKRKPAKKRKISKPKKPAFRFARKLKRPKRAQVRRPMYALNTDFGSFYELRDLILKSSPAEKDKMIERINKLGRVKLAIISGIFIDKENLDPLIADLLIVGDDVDSRKLHSFLKSLEAEVGKEIKFAVMDKEEFQYRSAMFDRFVRVLMEGPHEKLINKLGI